MLQQDQGRDHLADDLLPRRSLLWLWALHGLTMTSLAWMIGYPMYVDYLRIERQERLRLEGQAVTVGKNLARELGAIHHALQGVRADRAYWGQTPAGQPSPRLVTLVESMTGIRTFNIYDSEGTVIASNRLELIGKNFKQRAYFETARSLSDPSVVVVSPPFQTTLGVYGLNLVMMISGAHGEFAGIVSVTLNPDFFNTLVGSVLYAPDMWGAIVHGDGVLFLMVPERPGLSGSNRLRPGSLFFRHVNSGRSVTVLTGAITSTGEERMMAQVTVKPADVPMDKPLVVAITRDIHAVYAGWLADSGKQVALYLLFLIGLTLGLFIFQRRQLSFDYNLSQTARALEEARRQAEAASEAKSIFLATMSHEIRTPITSVLGMVDLLHTTGLNAEQAGYVDTLSQSTRVLLTVLNDILDISKVEAGKVVLEKVEFSLHDTARTVIALAQAIAGAKGLELSLEIASDVPDIVVGDPVRLKQILYNLLNNAVKFTEAGSVDLHVKLVINDGISALLHFAVSDTGIGIDEGEIERLFKPFSQVDTSTTRRFGGTGLGLAIARRLVDLAGGEIGVDSAAGQGACFWFTLPLGLPEPRAAVEPVSVVDVPEAEAPRTVRILLAEDNRINQMLIASMLKKRGHTVKIVDDGQQALDAVIAGSFDIVLMDMQMPEMDGEEATAAIRALPAPKNRIPVLALTADVMPEHRARYLAAGVNDLVTKPIDWQHLLKAITVCTGRSGSR